MWDCVRANSMLALSSDEEYLRALVLLSKAQTVGQFRRLIGEEFHPLMVHFRTKIEVESGRNRTRTCDLFCVRDVRTNGHVGALLCQFEAREEYYDVVKIRAPR